MAPSEFYQTVENTATSFILATCPKDPGANELDHAEILSYLETETFRASWGHSYFVDTKPGLQGRKSADEFVQHLEAMSPHLGAVRMEIQSTVVDTEKREVFVRVDFHMAAKGYKAQDGKDGAVVNDILFWVGLTKDGKKVTSVVEFVDPVASQELAERMGKDEMKEK
nr:hypothetical protein CFP56_09976 [Quercus suber]